MAIGGTKPCRVVSGNSLGKSAVGGARSAALGTAAALLAGLVALSFVGRAPAGDLSVVPLFDGERADSLNLWGGPFGAGNTASFFKQSSTVRSGIGAYQAILGTVPDGGSKFFQTFSSSTAAGQRQDRSLTRYDSLQGYIRNSTTQELSVTLELKDYRDSASHRAKKSFTIPAGSTWEPLATSLDLDSGWVVDGSPDLSRTFAVSFLVDNNSGVATSGSLYLDDFQLIEKGPSIDVATAPMETIVERLAHRTFDALWSARNKTTGLIPNISSGETNAALNTTTGVVWNLPAAIRRGWVTQSDADAYMGQVVNSLHTNLNDQTTYGPTRYLPTRFLNLSTGAPQGSGEESSIDASFIALALHNYKSQETTPAGLRDAIDDVQNRFNFAAFVQPGGFNLAYNSSSNAFTPFQYSGYTNEGKVIALAADASEDFHVPLASMWNKDTGRLLASLTDVNQNHLTYSYTTEYRSPFYQALVNLFVDTSERGSDNYPNRNLARNPWQNFVRYEAEVAAKLEQLGRDQFLQPDAGRGAGTYHTWNLYHYTGGVINFGQPNLFQPWSAALALMAGTDGAEEALRFLLDNGLGTGLDGPLGLADSAQWAIGAANPTSVPSLADNWNMTLSLMAMMEYLEGSERASLFFANLPEVKAALDTVFVEGDYNGDGDVTEADFTYWRGTFGSRQLLAADGNNNGRIDAGDYTIWRDAFEAGGGGSGTATIPEPGAGALAVMAWFGLAFARRFNCFTSGLQERKRG